MRPINGSDGWVVVALLFLVGGNAYGQTAASAPQAAAPSVGGWTDDGSVVRLPAGKKVGIGTDNPQALLHVEGDALIHGTLRAGGGSWVFSTLPGEDRAQVTSGVATFGSFANPFSNIKVGIGVSPPTGPTVTLDVNGQTRVRNLPVSSNSNDIVVADALGNLLKRNVSTFNFADADWNFTTSAPNMFSIPVGNVGIGTSAPTAKLHVNQTITANNGEGVRVDFTNPTPSFGAFGINVQSPVKTNKGTQVGVNAQVSVSGGGGGGSGSALGSLATVSDFTAQGLVRGVTGIANPDALSNFDATKISTGAGGVFISRPTGTGTLTLDTTGTYWVGGSYSEVSGKIDGPSASGAVAAVIGVDSQTGTHPSYAGFFSGKVRVTNLPPNNALNTVVVTDSTGLLQAKDLSQQEPWITPTLTSGCTVGSGGAPQYYKDAIGRVHFRGSICSPTGTCSSANSFTLPAAYWPFQGVVFSLPTFALAGFNFNNPIAPGAVMRVQNNGPVVIYHFLANQCVFMDEVSYRQGM